MSFCNKINDTLIVDTVKELRKRSSPSSTFNKYLEGWDMPPKCVLHLVVNKNVLSENDQM